MQLFNLGYPRIGPNRELKRSLEAFWSGKQSEADLLDEATRLRESAWQEQVANGIPRPPSNDFSLYDHVLDTALMVGAVPARFRGVFEEGSLLKAYFAMARGTAALKPLELTKWFNTNYHFLVPEFEADMRFSLSSNKAVSEYAQAKALGIGTRPVLLGPVTFALLGKLASGTSRESVLRGILPVYTELLSRLEALGAEWVQLDEPMLVTELDAEAQALYRTAYAHLSSSRVEIMLTTYFGHLRGNLDLATSLPVAGLHVDLVRAPEQLDLVLASVPDNLVLSLGVVDGRNIWKTGVEQALTLLESAVRQRDTAERLQVAPSCSLLHSPINLDLETDLDPEVKGWLAFAVQKLGELATLASAMDSPQAVRDDLVEEDRARLAARKASPRVTDTAVQARVLSVEKLQLERTPSAPERRGLQAARLDLPLLPTTTIGSFPQTAEIRRARADAKAGRLDAAAYEDFLEARTRELIDWQEELGFDVLVHGEFERNDMVEYFGERLDGFAFTRRGWVQSYGSRCVKPPIIYGDVSRPAPMTVHWATFAQGLTDKPVKGMLTGPVTILKWSFVRDDQPLAETCQQIALAIRDEVLDLEVAGLKIIQIDEAALREGLPIHPDEWEDYMRWSIDAFLLTAGGVKAETQIHTYMCYSDFGEILGAVARMDADVVTLEASRSGLDELEAFRELGECSVLGLGVYDIHSPRIPQQTELEQQLRQIVAALGAEHVWVNPDCGLKTRQWEEVRPALRNMIGAARQVRQAYTVELD